MVPVKLYKYIHDPSHGWLRVPIAELVELKIYDKISTYSYRKDEYAYLEEDRDMAHFIDAKMSKGEWSEEDVEDIFLNSDSVIRDMAQMGISA